MPILFLIDTETAFVFEEYKSGNPFILSEEEWEQVDKSKLKSYSAIVILSELNWEGKSLNDDFGISIALELRRKHKCLLPIVLCSSMPQSFFELRANMDLKYNLIYGRGNYFVPLINIQEDLKETLANAEPINLPVLTDMNEMLFNLRGVLSDTLGHRLQADMTLSSFEAVMKEMEALLNEAQHNFIGWTGFYQKLSRSLSDSLAFNTLKSEFLYKIQTILPGADISSVTITSIEKRHKILLVEDDAIFTNQLISKLEPYFEQIVYTDNAKQAITLLKEDTGNAFSGIICDWRLYKKDASKKYWQKQGYEILLYASQHKIMALFGITSLTDANVHNIRNMLGFDMHLFKKEHFQGIDANSQWQIMADIILQRCDAAAQLIASAPTSSSWQKLKKEYIEQRNYGWLAYEAEITEEANKIFSFYQDAIEEEYVHNVFSISEMGLILKNNLKNILVVRRVYMGLYFMLNKKNIYLQKIRPVSLLGDGEKTDTELKHHAIDAYSIIRKDWWDDIESGASSVILTEEWEKYEQRQKNFRNTLCIDISVLPKKGLLPEEKAWMLRNEIDYSFLFNYWTDEI